MLRTFFASLAVLILALLAYLVTTPSLKHQLATVALTSSTYQDDFADESGIATLTNVLVSGGSAAPDSGAVSAISPIDPSGSLGAGLLALFHFNGNLTNATATSISASLLGNTTCNTTSASGLGQACTFDGSSGGISLGNVGILEAKSALSIAAWVKPTLAEERRRVIMEKDNVMTLQTQSVNGGPIGARLYASGGSSADVSASAPPTSGDWVHVAVVYNGSTLTEYINGTAQPTAALSGVTVGPIGGNVTIGGGTASNDRIWNGLIDEVGVWNRALTAGEIATISAGGNQTVTYQLVSKAIDMSATANSITGSWTGSNLSGATLEISPTGSGSWCTITPGVAADTAACGITGQTFYYRVTFTDTSSTLSQINFSWSNDAGEVSGTTYYVSPSGSDSNDGSSVVTPFKTIQHAIDTVSTAGTTIILASGTYNEEPTIFQKDGNSTARMVLKAATDATPVITGVSASGGHGIRIFKSAYWTIDGIEVTAINGTGVLVEAGDHAIIKNVRAHDNTGVGILVLGSSDVTVEYNDVYANSLGIKISQELINGLNNGEEVRSDRPIVRYNLAHDNLTGGGGADGIDLNGGDYGIAEYNLVWQNYDDGMDNSSNSGGTDHASHEIFRYNATWRNGPVKACPAGPGYAACVQCPQNGDCGNGAGIKTSTNTGGDDLIHHNISFDNTLAGFDNDQEADWGPNRFYNNTAYGNDKGIALDMAGISAQLSAAYVKNNLLAGATNPSAYGGDLRPSGTYAINESDYNFIADGLFPAGEGAHSLVGNHVTGDPLLVNPAGTIDVDYSGNGGIAGKWQYIWDQIQDNFALQAGSLAINAGVAITDATTSENVTSGYVGLAPDLGAVEYDPNGGAITTHTISVSAGSNGSISPSGSVSVVNGANQSFTITPNTGFNIASLTIDGVGTATSTTYRFTNIVADHTLAATFVAKNSSGGGSSGGGGGGGGSSSGGGSSVTVTSQNSIVATTSTPLFPPLTSLFAIYTRGAHVTQLQKMLAVDGFYQGQVSGYYDDATIKAVQAFQTKFNILKSGSPSLNGFGLSGPTTRAKLNELYATGTLAIQPLFSPLTSLFAIYTRGAHVTQLQKMLAVDGFYQGQVSGYYDDATIKAVQAFQTKYGLLSKGSPTTNGFGLSGPATRAKLNQLYASRSGTSFNSQSVGEVKTQIQNFQQELINLLRRLWAK